jgi:hypothetical protein
MATGVSSVMLSVNSPCLRPVPTHLIARMLRASYLCRLDSTAELVEPWCAILGLNQSQSSVRAYVAGRPTAVSGVVVVPVDPFRHWGRSHIAAQGCLVSGLSACSPRPSRVSTVGSGSADTSDHKNRQAECRQNNQKHFQHDQHGYRCAPWTGQALSSATSSLLNCLCKSA